MEETVHNEGQDGEVWPPAPEGQEVQKPEPTPKPNGALQLVGGLIAGLVGYPALWVCLVFFVGLVPNLWDALDRLWAATCGSGCCLTVTLIVSTTAGVTCIRLWKHSKMCSVSVAVTSLLWSYLATLAWF